MRWLSIDVSDKAVTDTEFRQITSDEAKHAYDIIRETVEWLRSNGLKGWNEPIPIAVYNRRQRNGQNFTLTVDGAMAVVLSLTKEFAPHWSQETDQKRVWWLCTLATANDFRGRGLGQVAVCRVLEYLRDKGICELFLDCEYGSGFLPSFYESLGFQRICRKVIEWPKCGKIEMVLMKYHHGRNDDS